MRIKSLVSIESKIILIMSLWSIFPGAETDQNDKSFWILIITIIMGKFDKFLYKKLNEASGAETSQSDI